MRKGVKNKKPEQYNISKKYFEFLGNRTKLNNTQRYNAIFRYQKKVYKLQNYINRFLYNLYIK